MAVDTLEFDGLTVDVIVSSSQSELVLTCWCILNLDCSESSLETYRLKNFLSLHQFTHDNIHVRRFCGPGSHVVDR